jgi:hypothetical protein
MSQLNYPVKLHQAQRKILLSPARFRVTVNGRRFGKTRLTLDELVLASLRYPREVSKTSPETVIGVLPTLTQAKQILWKPLVNLCETEPLSRVVRRINKSDFTIDFYNKPSIRIAGANDNNGDRLRGLRILFASLDESQDIRPSVFSDVIRPAMSDTVGSRALFTGTPKGKLNHLYHLAELAKSNPDWEFFNFPTWTNPTIPREEIERARATLPPRLFAQEYEASFVDFPGKWFTELSYENMYYEDTLPKFDLCVMGIDWGDLHPSLNVLGRAGRTWYYLEGWSPNPDPRTAQPIPDPILHSNIKRLVKKWNVAYTYCDPSRPSAILAVRGLGVEPGYRNAIAGYNPIVEGISQVHALITQRNLLFTGGFHDKVQDALDGHQAYTLHEAYHRKTDKNGHFTDEPEDGYESHVVDGTRYSLATRIGG